MADSIYYPKGRSVYISSCECSYIVPNGQPDIMSVDDLEQLAVIDLDDLEGTFFADADYRDVIRWDPDMLQTKVTLQPICPACKRPSRDREDIFIGDQWGCTECGTLYENDEDAKDCCGWKKHPEPPTLPTPSMLLSVSQMPSGTSSGGLDSYSNQQLQDELDRRMGFK